MEFLFNDLSLAGQFQDIPTFKGAIGRLMEIRKTINDSGCKLHCHRDIGNARVSDDMVFSKAVHGLARDKERAVMQWATREGPFWDDNQTHDQGEWLECCDGTIVTDTAIGEAAYRSLEGNDWHLVSLTPSSWEFTPIRVVWRPENSERNVDIQNHWEKEPLVFILQDAPQGITSWDRLKEIASRRFTHLTFSQTSFEPLRGVPFIESAADRITERFRVLDAFKNSFGEDGERTPEGQDIYQQYFTGDKAWFSDSSDNEKHRFRNELTFPHPETGELKPFPWHGKLRANQQPLRIHFSRPARADEPLYVVYVGPKLTKR